MRADFLGKAFFVGVACGVGMMLVAGSAHAKSDQDQEPVKKKYNPCMHEEGARTENFFDKFSVARSCADRRTIAILTPERLEELAKFSDGTTLRILRAHYRTILELYPVLRDHCAKDAEKNSKGCRAFNEKSLNSPIISIAYFHALFFMQDPEMLRRWIRTMPFFNVNLIVHATMAERSSKFRFTFAEIAAGHPNASLEMLKVLYEEGVIRPNSRESYPLSSAIINGHYDRFRYLLDRGFDVNALDKKDLLRIVPAERLKGVPLDEPQTPLIRAISYRRLDVFQDLLRDPRIDVNLAGSSSGLRPLMNAAYYAMLGPILLDPAPVDATDPYFMGLLAHPQIDVNAWNDAKQTALTYLSSNFQDPRIPVSQGAYVKMLLDHPGFVFARHCHAENPCMSPVMRQKSADKLAWYLPLAPFVNFEERIYRFGNVTGMNLLEFAEFGKDRMQNSTDRRAMAESIRMLKHWRRAQ